MEFRLPGPKSSYRLGRNCIVQQLGFRHMSLRQSFTRSRCLVQDEVDDEGVEGTEQRLSFLSVLTALRPPAGVLQYINLMNPQPKDIHAYARQSCPQPKNPLVPPLNTVRQPPAPLRILLQDSVAVVGACSGGANVTDRAVPMDRLPVTNEVRRPRE
ncbi:hypothetical protein BST61_g3597 [Cercospora zeina]